MKEADFVRIVKAVLDEVVPMWVKEEVNNRIPPYAVYRGFQDEFHLMGMFPTEDLAKAFIEVNGWTLGKEDPITPAVWIRHTTPTSSRLTTK